MSDDTEAYKASQQRHAAAIATERKLSEITGMSRNQIRQSLKNATGAFVESVQERAQRTQPKEGARTVTDEKTTHSTPQTLAARTFSQDSGGQRTPGGGEIGEETFIVVINGVAKRYNFAAEFKENV